MIAAELTAADKADHEGAEPKALMRVQRQHRQREANDQKGDQNDRHDRQERRGKMGLGIRDWRGWVRSEHALVMGRVALCD